MGVANVPAASAAGLQPKYQKFTSSGTFTLPTGYGVSKPLLVQIQVIGGGGAGSPSRITSSGNFAAMNINGNYANYFGNGNTYNYTFPATTLDHTTNANYDFTSNRDGKGGGSGGIAQTQMYLTSNLSITVGAAGARPGISTISTWGIQNDIIGYYEGTQNGLSATGNDNTGYPVRIAAGNGNYTVTAGSGGTSTAGAVSATGGVGATSSGTLQIYGNYSNNNMITSRINTNSGTLNLNTTLTAVQGGSTYAVGSAGSPAGSAGDATPLLGALAGGSGTSTPVYGAFGVGGKKTDGASHTGVEGTGGGFGSIGASGAVILTWWE